MDYLYVIIGLNTMWIFMFNMDWLFNLKSLIIIIAIDCFLLSVSLMLLANNSNSKSIALLMPLISLSIFHILSFFYKSIYKRHPKNTFHSLEKQKIADIIFTIMFWIIGVGMPFFVIHLFYEKIKHYS